MRHQPFEGHKGALSRAGERGNVFFTLFGAVAVVGTLGAGIMGTMRGPLSTMVEINRIEETKAELSVTLRLVLLPASDQDTDVLTEPVDPATCTTAPTGAGCLPSTVNAKQRDAWGTPLAYCAWNNGNDTDPIGSNILRGAYSTNNISVALISAGPDREFDTDCTGVGGGVTQPTLTPSSGGGDDIVRTYNYNDAVAGTDGLWALQNAAGDDFARVEEEISVGGGADAISQFEGGATFGGTQGLALTDTSAAVTSANVNADIINSFDGTQDYVEFARGIVLGDTGSCSIGGLMRFTTADGFEFCDGSNWVEAGKWLENSSGELYYDEAFVGIGNDDPATQLDVSGVTTLDDVDISATLDVEGLSTMDSVVITADSGNHLDVDSGNLLVDSSGNVGIGNPATIDDALEVAGIIDTDSEYKLDDVKILSNDGVDSNILIGDVVSNAPGTASNYLNIGDVIHGDLTTANKNVIIGAADSFDVSTLTDTLNVVGSTDISDSLTVENDITATTGNVTVTAGNLDVTAGNITAGGTITATGNITGNHLFKDGSTHAISDIVACTDADKKLEWTDGAGWSCESIQFDLDGDGTIDEDITLETVLQAGNDAGELNALNFAKLGADEYCDDGGTNCVAVETLLEGSQIWSRNPGDTTEIRYTGGRVGVGVADPGSAFHMLGDFWAQGGNLLLDGDNNNNFFGMTEGTDNLYFSDDENNIIANARMVITSGGVGILKNTAETALDVNGTLRIGAGTEACDNANHIGGLRYNATAERFEMCRDPANGWEQIAGGGGGGAAPSLGLVSHWRLDEDTGTQANDSISTNHGSFEGGMTPAGATTDGVISPAMTFDGTDDCIALPDLSEAEDGEFTYAIWVKTMATDGYLIGEGGTSSANRAAIRLVGGELRGIWDSSSGNQLAVSTVSINDGAWRHVVLTGDGSTMRLYVDGREAAPANTSIGTGTMDLNQGAIGCLKAASSTGHLAGEIDDARLYNIALSDDEVFTLFQATGGANSIWARNGDFVYYNDGNVGIGTETPRAKLHVGGGLKLGPATTCGTGQKGSVRLNTNEDGLEMCDGLGNWITVAGEGTTGANGSSLWKDDGPEADEIYYNVANVGIGTNNPGYNLEVDGTIGLSGDLHLAKVTTGEPTYKPIIISSLEDEDGDTRIQLEESTDEDKIRFDTDDAERMIIDTNGFVGVGTSDPDTRFDVVGTIQISDGGELCNVAAHEGSIRYRGGSVDRFEVCRDHTTAAWEPIGAGSGDGDNLGNHTATENLDMATYKIDNLQTAIFELVPGNAPVGAPGVGDLWSETGGVLHPSTLTQNVAIGSTGATLNLDISANEPGLRLLDTNTGQDWRFIVQNASGDFELYNQNNSAATPYLSIRDTDGRTDINGVLEANEFIWEGGVNRITNNDGAGNVQIRFGNQFNSGEVFTHGGGAAYIKSNIDATSNTVLDFAVSSNPGAGDGAAVSWGSVLRLSDTDLRLDGNVIFHGGNDGAGSGLDADTLDGQHASAFLTSENDPQVGALTNGNWCRASGGAVVCDQAAPSGDNLGSGGSTSGTLYSKNGSGYGYVGTDGNNYIRFDDNSQGNEAYFRLAGNWEYQIHSSHLSPYDDNANDLGRSDRRWQDVHAVRYYGDGSNLTGTGDNLGNHTATTSINLNTNDLNNFRHIRSSLSNGWATIGLDGNVSTKSLLIAYGGDAQNELLFQRRNNNHGSTVEAQPVKFDMDAPDSSLVLNGSGNLIVGGSISVGSNIFFTSDARKKQDIKTLNGSLEQIRALRSVAYHWKPETNMGDHLQLGFIAQEVEEIFPNLVHTNEDGFKSLDYTGLISPLVDSVQELDAKIETGRDDVAALKQEVSALRAENAALKDDFATLSRDVAGLKAYTGYGTAQASMIGLLALLIGLVMGGGIMVLTQNNRQTTRQEKA